MFKQASDWYPLLNIDWYPRTVLLVSEIFAKAQSQNFLMRTYTNHCDCIYFKIAKIKTLIFTVILHS